MGNTGYSLQREPAFSFILARWIQLSLTEDRLCIAMASHDSLGFASPMASLPRELNELIASYLWPVDSEKTEMDEYMSLVVTWAMLATYIPRIAGPTARKTPRADTQDRSPSQQTR